MTGKLIEKYGRFKAHQIVASFYDRVLSSPRLQPYFDGIDIQDLVDHQSAFLRAPRAGKVRVKTETGDAAAPDGGVDQGVGSPRTRHAQIRQVVLRQNPLRRSDGY